MKSWKILEECGYEFIHWDYDRCREIINQSPFIKRCYEAGAYAFVCDYIRCYALYYYGGIYLDCDVEVLKPFDDLLNLPYAISIENKTLDHIEFAIMLFSSDNNFIKDMLEFYKTYNDDKNYIDIIPIVALRVLKDTSRDIYYLNIPEDLEKLLKDNNNNLYLFPKEYFSPKPWGKEQYTVSSNSYTIHHFNGSWAHSKKEDSFQTEPYGISIKNI